MSFGMLRQDRVSITQYVTNRYVLSLNRFTGRHLDLFDEIRCVVPVVGIDIRRTNSSGGPMLMILAVKHLPAFRNGNTPKVRNHDGCPLASERESAIALRSWACTYSEL